MFRWQRNLPLHVAAGAGRVREEAHRWLVVSNIMPVVVAPSAIVAAEVDTGKIGFDILLDGAIIVAIQSASGGKLRACCVCWLKIVRGDRERNGESRDSQRTCKERQGEFWPAQIFYHRNLPTKLKNNARTCSWARWVSDT